jgi:ParB-like chromosome segregation protein Spo0J
MVTEAQQGEPAKAVVLWYDEERDPSALLAHPRNPRTHSPEQVTQLRSSMRQWGFTNPALITHDGRILAGHGRVEAALAEAYPRVPVRVRNPEYPLTPAQELALVVADNKLALNAGWDYAALTDILKDMTTEGLDLSLTGFDELERRNLVGTLEAGVSPEQAALRQTEPVDSDMWPVVSIKMPRVIFDKWQKVSAPFEPENWYGLLNDMIDRFEGTGS